MKCTFCGNEVTPGTGLMYVKKDAKIFYFCKSKCRRNMIDLGRKPRETTWTATAAADKAERAKLAKK